MPAVPTVSDLATWLRQEIGDDDATALLVVAAANGLVLDAAPGSSAWGGTWPQTAHTIAVVAAARAWVNPTGARRNHQTTGPFSDNKEWDASGVMLTPEEEAKLAGLGLPDVGGVPGLSSVRVVAPAGTSPAGSLWAEVQQYDLDPE